MDQKQDITVLDEEAHRMRVNWDKAMNFIASFNHAYRENEQRIASGNFGWTYNSWLLAKVGIPEKTCLRVMESVARYAQLGEQERDRERLQEIAREKKAERDRRKAEKQATTERLAAARAAREAKRPKPPLTPPPTPPKLDPRLERDAPLRERAVQAILAVLVAGKRVNKYQISRETGISHGVMDVAYGVALERFRQSQKAKPNGSGPPATSGASRPADA